MENLKDQFLNGKHIIELLRENNLSKAMLLRILGISTEDYKFVSLTKNRIEVIKAYESGMPIKDICSNFGIREIIVKHCINRKTYLLNSPYINDYYIKKELIKKILNKYMLSTVFFYDCIKELGMYKRNDLKKEHTKICLEPKYKIQDLENYINQGMTLKEIAKIYGVTRQAIHQVLKRYDMETMTRSRYANFYKENSERIKQLRLEGYSLESLSKEFKVSMNTIKRCLTDLNLDGDIRGYSKQYRELLQYKDDIIKKYLEGASIRYLSNYYGFHRTLIERLLKNSSVELRSQILKLLMIKLI